MTTVAERPQNLQALDQANAIRIEGAKQRRALCRQSPAVVIPALIDPPTGLSSYRLSTLFSKPTLIAGVGNYVLRKAMRDVESRYPRGRRFHTELRLRDLTRPERERLAEALVKRAPKGWREAA